MTASLQRTNSHPSFLRQHWQVLTGLSAALLIVFVAKDRERSPLSEEHLSTQRESSRRPASEERSEVLRASVVSLRDVYDLIEVTEERLSEPRALRSVSELDPAVPSTDPDWERITRNQYPVATFVRSGFISRRPELLFRNSHLNPDDIYIPPGLRENLVSSLKNKGAALAAVDLKLAKAKAERAKAFVRTNSARQPQTRALPDSRIGYSSSGESVTAIVLGKPAVIPKSELAESPEVMSLRNSIALEIGAHAIHWFRVNGYITNQQANAIALDISRRIR